MGLGPLTRAGLWPLWNSGFGPLAGMRWTRRLRLGPLAWTYNAPRPQSIWGLGASFFYKKGRTEVIKSRRRGWFKRHDTLVELLNIRCLRKAYCTLFKLLIGRWFSKAMPELCNCYGNRQNSFLPYESSDVEKTKDQHLISVKYSLFSGKSSEIEFRNRYYG